MAISGTQAVAIIVILIIAPPTVAQILIYPEGCVPSWMACVDNVGWPYTDQSNCCEEGFYCQNLPSNIDYCLPLFTP